MDISHAKSLEKRPATFSLKYFYFFKNDKKPLFEDFLQALKASGVIQNYLIIYEVFQNYKQFVEYLLVFPK